MIGYFIAPRYDRGPPVAPLDLDLSCEAASLASTIRRELRRQGATVMSTDPDWSYRHVPGSPDYRDPGENLEEATGEELESLLDLALSAAENPDTPARVRRQCDEAARAILAEMGRRGVAA